MKKTILIIISILVIIPIHAYSAEKKISAINIINVKHFNKDDLLDIIHSQKKKTYEPRFVKLDKILLSNFYRKKGFLDIAVEDSVIFSRNRRKVEITYIINEGQRYYYAGARFRGIKEMHGAAVTKQFKGISINSPFDESLINESVRKVENVYYNSGKPFVEMHIDYLYEQDSLICVLISIKENQTVYIKDIKYLDRKMVQKFLIRRELEFKKGDKYNREALDLSQQNIYSTGLFKYVRFEIEPIENEPDQVVLKIFVQEKDPRWIGVRFGIAYEQEEYYGNKFEFTLQGGHRNLFGTARSISLHLTPSLIYDFNENKLHNPNNKASLMFVEPWIGYTRTPGIFQIAYQQYRPLNSGHFDLWYTSFGVRHNFKNYIELSGAISAKLVDNLSDAEIDSTIISQTEADKSQVYSITFYGKRDKRKNVFNPTNSSYTDLRVGFSFSYGKDKNNNLLKNEYITMVSSWQRYQPFRPKVLHFKRWRFTFASRLKLGGIYELGKSKSIPQSDLFFAGGATSVRGYQEQLLGPALEKDEKGRITKAAGGKMLFLANAELRMPIIWLIVLETFVDGGYVWREINNFRPADIKFTTGLGLAVITPLGPVRLDYGYKLMKTDLDPAPDAFHFGIYFAF
jgi:outer membrane protein insertion porin family